jgi:hypothetical protein
MFSPVARRGRAENTYGIGLTGEDPEGSAEEGEETQPKLCPPDGFDCLGLAAPVEVLQSEG